MEKDKLANQHYLEIFQKKTKRNYASLDNIKFRQLAKTDPELFLQQNPPPVIIDEVQICSRIIPLYKNSC